MSENLNTVYNYKNPALSALDDIATALSLLKEASTQERQKITRDLSEDVPRQLLSHSFASVLSHWVLHLEEILYRCSDIYSPKSAGEVNPLEASRYCQNETIQIAVSPTKIIIRMPHLPPRTSRNSLVTEALASKLFHMTTLPRWPRCVVDFYHVYPTDIPKMPKDVDNYAYKRTIDLLMFALQSSDCATAFRDSRQTIFTDVYPQGTYIIICPESSENNVFQKFEEAVGDAFYST